MAGLEQAISLAVEKHRGQRDKSGEPYVLHPMRVMMRVRERGGSEAAQCAAILHDVVEDCDVTLDDLRKAGFSDEVVRGVEAVTKQPAEKGDAGYEGFVKRAAADPIGRMVKLADLEDNMDLRRLDEMGERGMRRLERYLKAWRSLTSLK
jgi:(p)ppGpp synthase/HD superfamily hydrolase